MPYQSVPLVAADVSQFAKTLRAELALAMCAETERRTDLLPGHQEMLNLLARAAGHRNYQALRAASSATPHLAHSADERPLLPLTPTARKALLQFDRRGRLVRWPNKLSVQRLCMWALWTRFEARRLYTERDVNTILKAAHAFGDHATLRREWVNHKLLGRKADCSKYRKLPARADAETQAMLQAWRELTRQPPPVRRTPPEATAAE